MNRFWPSLKTIPEAEDVMGQSALWLFVLCALNILLNGYALSVGHSVLGADGWGLVDGAIFALIGWRILRYSFWWALTGFLFYLAEISYGLSERRGPGFIGIIILLALISAVRAAWFLRKSKLSGVEEQGIQTTKAPPPPAPLEQGSVSHPTRSEDNLPDWLPEMREWVATRLRAEELITIDSEAYRAHLFRTILSARSAVLSNEEFATLCKVTSGALVLRTYLAIEGGVAAVDEVDIIFAMLSTLPRFKTFYSLEQISSGVVPLITLTKMSLFEGEMFGVLYAFLTGEHDRFSRLVTEMSDAAKAYWRNPSNRKQFEYV